MASIDVVSLLSNIQAAYPRFNGGEAKFWKRALEQYDERTLDLALQKHVESSKFAPTIADIKQQCISIVGERPRQETPRDEVSRAQYVSENTRSGLVQVHYQNSDGNKTWRWEKRENCLRGRGKWRRQIDYINQHLPPDYIKKQALGVTGTDNWFALVSNAKWAEAWRKIRAELCEEAAFRAGDHIELGTTQ